MGCLLGCIHIYAYNTSIHESTSFSPFKGMFGRKTIMPIDIEMSTKISAIDNEVSSTDIEMLAKQRQIIISMTKETILEAPKSQKYVYDRKHANPNYFAIGELVVMKDFRRKKRAGGELDSKYVELYTITKCGESRKYSCEG